MLRKRIIYKGRSCTVVFVDENEKVFTEAEVEEMKTKAAEEAVENEKQKKSKKKEK